VVAGAAGGCSYPSNDAPYPGACTPLEPVAWTPAGFSVGAPTDVTIAVQFDDYPDPDTVRSDSLLLTTGYYWVPATYSVDLIHRTALLHPWAPLGGDLGYTVHLMPKLASLQGCPTLYTLREFVTGAGPAGTPLPPVPAFTDVQAIFASRCAGGCHLDASIPAPGCIPAAAAGLSLCAPDAWAALVGVPSREESRLELVQAGDSARSYLLRKLLPVPPSGAPPAPTLGHRDPPGGPPLDEAELETIAAWIDGGAKKP
jgi:hypothetical protein